jgi:hypothetical protein
VVLGKGFLVGKEVIWIRVGCFRIAKMTVLEDFKNTNDFDRISFYSYCFVITLIVNFEPSIYSLNFARIHSLPDFVSRFS